MATCIKPQMVMQTAAAMNFLAQLLLLVAATCHANWFSIDPSARIEFDTPELKSLFDGNNATCPVINVKLEKVYNFCEFVVQKFHFTSNTAILLNLHDQFCAGQSYTVFDNGIFLADNFPSLPTICGVSTSFQNLEIIKSPEFMTAEYPLPPGEHRLLIVVAGSKIGRGVSSMQILLIPNGPIVGGDGNPVVKMSKMSKEVLHLPNGSDTQSVAMKHIY